MLTGTSLSPRSGIGVVKSIRPDHGGHNMNETSYVRNRGVEIE